MKKKHDTPAARSALRRKAEDHLSRAPVPGPESPSEPDTLRLVHELEVHQVELEMQNEELRHTRDQLEALLQKYTDLYDFAPAGYLTLDRRAAIRQLNLTAARLLGADRASLVDQPIARFVADDDRQTLAKFLESAMASEQQVACDVSLARQGLDPLIARIEGTRSADGEELRVVVLDITERHRAVSSLRVQSAALNAAANAVVITDRAGAIVWINSAFTTLTGYDSSEAIGRKPGLLLNSGVHDAAFYRRMWETITSGHDWHGEVTNRRKDGSLFPEDLTITPVTSERGDITHFIAIKRDLTQEKALQAQFLQSQKMESIGRMAGGVAHDFNNLLSVIGGTADLALAGVALEHPLRDDLLEIRRAVERAASLTRQLLAFGRRQIMRPRVLNLNAVVEGTRKMVGRLIGEDVSLVVHTDATLGSVRADPGQIEQIILNLAVNSRDAMPLGGTLTIETKPLDDADLLRLGHVPEFPGPYVALIVRDTGAGMDDATRARAFEPFFTTKESGKGTGLGLSSTYGIVKQSGGSIWVDSKVAEGTTVMICLPRVEEVPDTEPPTAPLPEARGNETVLVVEDERALGNVARRVLRSAGYTVLMAESGDDALRLLALHPGTVNLLLTDVVMPGISGPELARRIGSAYPRMKVLFTSGYTDDDVLRRGVHDNIAHFLGKPYSIVQLTKKVREVLDSDA